MTMLRYVDHVVEDERWRLRVEGLGCRRLRYLRRRRLYNAYQRNGRVGARRYFFVYFCLRIFLSNWVGGGGVYGGFGLRTQIERV